MNKKLKLGNCTELLNKMNNFQQAKIAILISVDDFYKHQDDWFIVHEDGEFKVINDKNELIYCI